MKPLATPPPIKRRCRCRQCRESVSGFMYALQAQRRLNPTGIAAAHIDAEIREEVQYAFGLPAPGRIPF